MSEAAVICETSRRTFHSFPPSTANRGEKADYRTGASGLTLSCPSMPLKSHSIPELRILGVSNDRAEHGRPSKFSCGGVAEREASFLSQIVHLAPGC